MSYDVVARHEHWVIKAFDPGEDSYMLVEVFWIGLNNWCYSGFVGCDES